MVILPSFHFTVPNMMERRCLYIASYAFCSFRIANTVSQPPTTCAATVMGFMIAFHRIYLLLHAVHFFFMSVHLSFRGT